MPITLSRGLLDALCERVPSDGYVTTVRLAPPKLKRSCSASLETMLSIPTHKAFAELGKAVKAIFLCLYLHSEELRREINDGLNVIE
jgi:hypothetical protein